MDSLVHVLFQIESIEVSLPGATSLEVDEARAQLTLLIGQLPKPVRDQYEWLRTWTAYPIARLRRRACTGCAATYPEDHAFVIANETQVTYCEHCLRILLLKDLALVA
jgi:predicted  nucleic acid-binding Zn-ribbon protein